MEVDDKVKEDKSGDTWNQEGYNLDHGVDCKVDHEKALQYFIQGARHGHTEAAANVALFYRIGRGCTIDLAKSFQFCLQAARQGHEDCMAWLVWHYRRGKGVEKDLVQCFFWSQKGAQMEKVWGYRQMGFCYLHGQGCPKKYKLSVEWYIKGAHAGDVDSMAKLGWFYEEGHGVPQDYKEAFRWYEQAAKHNDIYAMTSLATLYEEGHGCEKDLRMAFTWSLKAGQATDQNKEEHISPRTRMNAYYELAERYRLGTGCEPHLGAALIWHEKASDLGDGRALHKMGMIYIRTKEYKKAQDVLTRSSKISSPNDHCAMMQLAWMIEEGFTHQDQDRRTRNKLALATYEQAAHMGCANACRALAISYETGDIVEKDKKKAYEWYMQAVKEHSLDALDDMIDCYKSGVGCEKDEKLVSIFQKVKTLVQNPKWVECSICLTKGRLRKTVCGHTFHTACLVEWVISQKSCICPLCRQDFV